MTDLSEVVHLQKHSLYQKKQRSLTIAFLLLFNDLIFHFENYADSLERLIGLSD